MTTANHPQNVPHLVCRVATPSGDLPVTEEGLRLPLDGCNQGTTYGDYFAVLHYLLLRDDRALLRNLEKTVSRSDPPIGIILRAEKHGALYHPASLELVWEGGDPPRRVYGDMDGDKDGPVKFALLTAISGHGRAALRNESQALDRLRHLPGSALLPCPLALVEDARATLLVVPWFSGFHEFHVAEVGGFSLWDHDQGVRRLGSKQIREVFFQAGRILTLCLDPETGACVHPWSHAAGDLIVRWDAQGVAVRLTTVRNHSQLIETDNPLSAMLAFVLDLALRMRLDRVEGVGEWIWLDQELMQAGVRGFYSGLGGHGTEAGGLRSLAELLPSFSAEDLWEGHESLLPLFSRAELETILPRLEAHCHELAAALRLASSST
ncbi:hypothetical protein [Desulfonatronum thioautotrophicum]|uniref:hypothetical protein n=1 Tax=Desulfonatronum thioautotrophicum TaxID=617001 RepID=UPI00069A890B|nr:hypothetical protein [Desulfonatronum thioautotrophicum]